MIRKIGRKRREQIERMEEVKNKGTKIKIKLGEEGKKGTERRGSTGNIEEIWKRKREKMEEGEGEK